VRDWGCGNGWSLPIPNREMERAGKFQIHHPIKNDAENAKEAAE